MKNLLLLILLSFMGMSCNRLDKPRKPDNLLSESQMVNIITDISLITAAKGVQKKVIEAEQINLEEFVFQKHNVDSVQFAESNNYYAYDVKTYENIYQRVNQRLENQKQEYLEIERKNLEKKDSIRKAKKEKMDSLRSKNTSRRLKTPNLLKTENKSQQ